MRTAIIFVLTIGLASIARADEALDKVASDAAHGAIAQFADEKIKEEELAVTVIDLRDSAKPITGSFRGDKPIFPASVVKLFYLAATQRWLEDGKLTDSDELRRTMHDMIVDSSNDATASILEALTDAPGGAPLPEDQMKLWAEKRNAVNKYFAGMGYTGINVCQKAYCEGPYGREKLFIGPKLENRNKLTTNATARLLSEIVTGKCVSTDRSQQMMGLLERDIAGKSDDKDDQAHGFTAMALKPKTKLWSKAGWTNTARHDAAYIETDDGIKAIIVIFTTSHAKQRQILPAIAEKVIESLKQSKAG